MSSAAVVTGALRVNDDESSDGFKIAKEFPCKTDHTLKEINSQID